MEVLFYLSAIVAVVSTVMVITRVVAVHALLYLIVSLLAVALVFYALGAPFAAALEVIIYAGAIMVMFLFVIMLLNLGPQAISQQRRWLALRAWIGPSLLIAVLLIELVYALARGLTATEPGNAIQPAQVGMAMFGPYVLGVELASMLLLAGLVGAHRLSTSPEPGQVNDQRENAL